MNKEEWLASIRMNKHEWLASTDPKRMIDWMEAQGYGEVLWDFATVSCRRVWDEIPSEPLRRIVEHFERVGLRGIDDPLHDGSKELDKLGRKLRKATNNTEAIRLNGQIGFANIVLMAFEAEDGASAARLISGGLLEWATDAAIEAQLQADSLRELVSDPSDQRCAE
jgi:hypothetical protein